MTGPDYATVQVKRPVSKSALRKSAASMGRQRGASVAAGSHTRVRMAILTVAIGAGPRCGLLQWCEAARRLQEVLSADHDVEIIVVGVDSAATATTQRADSRDCPGATIVAAEPSLEHAVRHCVTKKVQPRPFGAGRDPQRGRVLYGWHALSLSQFDVVLKSDLDVDLMPPEADAPHTRRRWRTMLRQLLPYGGKQGNDRRYAVDRSSQHRVGISSNDAPPLCIAHADHESPVNTGLMVLRPNSTLYQEGVRVLGECDFTPTHGWEGVGRPRSLDWVRPRHLDGATATDVGLGNEPNATSAQKHNSWKFVAGALDQGFFWYHAHLSIPHLTT